jgi:hypothetical protein
MDISSRPGPAISGTSSGANVFDLNPIKSAKSPDPIPNIPKIDLDELQLPQNKFLADSEGEDKFNLSSFISSATKLAENAEVISEKQYDAHKMAHEILQTRDSFGDAKGEELKEWTVLTFGGLYPTTLWIHLDKKNGKIGFYESPTDKNSTTKYNINLHSKHDDKNSVSDILIPLYSTYAVGNKDRLESKNLLKKLRELQESGSPKNARSILLKYLNAQFVELPSSEKAPHLYIPVKEIAVRSDSDLLLQAALGLRGTIGTKQQNSFVKRNLFLSLLDAQIDNLRNPKQADTQKLTLVHFVLDTFGKELKARCALHKDEELALLAALKKGKELFNLYQQAFTNVKNYSSIQYLEPIQIGGVRKAAGGNKKAVSEVNSAKVQMEQESSVGAILNYWGAPTWIKNLIGHGENSQAEGISVSEVNEDSRFDDNSVESGDDSSSESESLPVDESGPAVKSVAKSEEKPNVEIELDFSKYDQYLQQLQDAIKACSAPATLAEGLTLLTDWVQEIKANTYKDKKLQFMIIRGIVKALPLFEVSDFEKLSSEERDHIRHALVEFNSLNKIISEPYNLDNDLENYGLKDEISVAKTLIENLSGALLSSELKEKENPYSLRAFVANISHGVYFKDADVQSKAQIIVKRYFANEGIKDNSSLYNLQSIFRDSSIGEHNEGNYPIKNIIDLINVRLVGVLEPLKKQIENLNFSLDDMLISKDTKTQRVQFLRNLLTFLQIDELLLTGLEKEKYRMTWAWLKDQIDSGTQLVPRLLKEFTTLDYIPKDSHLRAVLLPNTDRRKLIGKIIEYGILEIDQDPKLKETLKNEWQKHCRVSQWSLLLHKVNNKIHNEFQQLIDRTYSESAYKLQYDILSQNPAYKSFDWKPLKWTFDPNNYKDPELCAKAYEKHKQELKKQFYLLKNTVLKDIEKICPDQPLLSKEWYTNLCNNENPEQVANEIRKALILHTIPGDPLIKVREPSSRELVEMQLFFEGRSKKDKGSFKYELLDILSESIPKKGIGDISSVLEDVTQNKWDSDENRDWSLERFINNKILNKHAFTESYYNSDSSDIGYQHHSSANDSANYYSYDSFYQEYGDGKWTVIPVSLYRAVKDMGSAQRDQMNKAINFMVDQPLLLLNKKIRNALEAYLYDFDAIGHLVSLGDDGLNLLNKSIPTQLNQLIDSLNSIVIDEAQSNADRIEAALALAMALHIAKNLKKHLSEFKAEKGENADKIDLSIYRNYQLEFTKKLGEDYPLELATNPKSKHFSSLFFANFTHEDMKNLTKEEKQGILFFIAGFAIQGQVFKNPFVIDFVEQLSKAERKQYREFALDHYFTSVVNKKRPVDVQIDESGDQLVHGRQSVLLSERLNFESALRELGVDARNPSWYLNNEYLCKNIRQQLGRDLSTCNVGYNAQKELYVIEGTKYSFNSNGQLFCWIGDRNLQYLSGGDFRFHSAVNSFNLSQIFEESKDFGYVDVENGTACILRDGKPQYRMDGTYLHRLKDDAVRIKESKNKEVWYKKSDGQYVPYSIQKSVPPAEYKFVTIDDQTRLESAEHEGFYLSNNVAVYGNTQLDFDSSAVLENDSGTQILITKIKDKFVSFTIENNRIQTDDPWNLLALILEKKSLIRELAPKMNLTPPVNDTQRAISKSLGDLIENYKPQRLEFEALMSLIVLDSATNGKNGGLYRIKNPDCFQGLLMEFLVYFEKCKIAPALNVSKETERQFYNHIRQFVSHLETENTIAFDVEKFKKNGAWAGGARFFYNNFNKIVGPRWNKLQTGQAEHRKESWEQLAPFSLFENRINIVLNEWGQESQGSTILPIIDKKAEDHTNTTKAKLGVVQDELKDAKGGKYAGKDFDPKVNLNSWQKIKEIFEDPSNEQTKERFVEARMLNFYHLATTLDADSRKAFIEWLEDCNPTDSNCNWFLSIARIPEKLPKLEQLAALNIPVDMADGTPYDLKTRGESWNDLKEIFESGNNSSKETFVKENIIDFYDLATSSTLTADDRKDLLEWLEFTRDENPVCDWASRVTRNSSQYPSLNTLVAEQIQYRSTKKKLEEEARLARIKYNSNNIMINEDWYSFLLAAESAEKAVVEHKEANVAKFNKSLSAFSWWSMISIVANAIFDLYSTALKLVQDNFSGLRLKVTQQRLFTVFKKQASSPQEGTCDSPIQAVDQSFNAYFSDIKAAVLVGTDRGIEDKGLNLEETTSELRQAQTEIKAFRSIPKGFSYAPKDNIDIAKLGRDLNSQKVKVKAELEMMKQQLVIQANQAATVEQQFAQMTKTKDLDWDAIKKLVSKNQEYAYQKHLADPSRSQAIAWGVHRCLAMQSRIYQMDRIEATLKLLSDPKSSKEEAFQKLGEQLSETRAYGGKQEDYWLLFVEAASPDGMFRKDQLDMILKLGIGSVVIAGMLTGWGKTTYVVPTVDEIIHRMTIAQTQKALDEKSRNTGEAYSAKQVFEIGTEFINKFVFNIWPTAIVDMCSKDIAGKTNKAFDKEVQRFSFTREATYDSVQLEAILVRLETAARKGISISCSMNDFASVLLHLFEVLHLIVNGDNTPEMLKKAEMFGRIAKYTFTANFSTIDEGHETLDPTQRTIYTLGKPVAPPEYAINFGADMWNILKENAVFKEIIDNNKTMLEEEVEEKLKLILTNETLKKIGDNLGIAAQDLPVFKQFLNGATNDITFKHKASAQNVFLARGYYTVITKSCIGGSVSEEFGLSVKHYKECKYAIPFLKKDVPKEWDWNPNPSCYKNFDETMLKTLRSYHVLGLTPDNMVDLVEKLVQKYLDEKKAIGGDRNLLPSYIALAAMFEKVGFSKLDLEEELFRKINIASREIDQEKFNSGLRSCIVDILGRKSSIVDKWKKDETIITDFVKLIAMPGYKIYPESVGVTPQELLRYLFQSLSLSATPQQTEVHSIRSEFEGIKGSFGAMYDLILSKTVGIMQTPKDEAAFIAALAEGAANRNLRAVGDPRGLKTFDLDFVKKLAAEFKITAPMMEYILYFDKEKNGYLRYEITSGTIQPYTRESHKPEVSFTLYDQARCTGTNIRHAQKARMAMVMDNVSPTEKSAITRDEVFQTGGRMRDLKVGHTLELWTEGNAFVGMDVKVALPEMFKIFEGNQKQTTLSKNKAAMQQNMEADLKYAMLCKMLDMPFVKPLKPTVSTTFDTEVMLSYFTKYQNEFISNEPYDAKALYGAIGAKVTGKESLESYHEMVIKKAESYFSWWNGDRGKVLNILEGYKEQYTRVPLPAEDYSCQVGRVGDQVQQEVSVSVATNVTIDTNELLDTSNKYVWPTSWININQWPATPTQFYNLTVDTTYTASLYKHRNRMQRSINSLRNRTLQTTGISSAVLEGRKIVEETYGSFISFISDVTREISKMFNSYEGALGKVYFKSAKDLLSYELPERLAVGRKFFTKNLFVSSNYLQDNGYHDAPIFDAKNPKTLTHMLLIKDVASNGTTSYSAVLVDSHDETQIQNLFERDKISGLDVSGRKRKMALYNFDSHAIVDQGKNRFDAADFNSKEWKEEVTALSAQARMFSGRLNYSDDEKAYLKSRIEKIKEIDPDEDAYSLVSTMFRDMSPRDLQSQNKAKFTQVLPRPLKHVPVKV